MHLNILCDEIHQNAVEHGFYEKEPTFVQIINLCHSELSEALEEYRKGCELTEIYYSEEDFIWNQGVPYSDNGEKRKPEGIPVELADCIIRILDYCGWKKIDVEDILKFRRAGNDYYTFPELLAECHCLLSQAYRYKGLVSCELCLVECVETIEFWCKNQDIDIWELVKLKHEYNKTRPYKHGGKII